MNDLVSEEAREWIGKSDDPIEVEVTRRDVIKYSVATEPVSYTHLRAHET